MSTPHLCIICGRDFYPATPDAAICHACGGPPEAPPPETVPQPTMLYTASQDGAPSQGTVFYRAEEAISATHLCILCGRDFVPRSPDEAICPACRGEQESISTSQATQVLASATSLSIGPPDESRGYGKWKPGDLVLDEYRVEKVLGEGGFGTVYLVRSERTGAVFAVKGAKLTTEKARQDFIAELQVWIDLPEYPHIVPLRFFRSQGNEILLFTDYVQGGSLNAWIKNQELYRGGAQQALPGMIDIAIQFAWGLHFLHHLGYIHEDVKPDNVLLTPDGIAKVSDFGLVRARALQKEEKRATTPAYHSPEQSLGQALSHKSDIWSYGVSLLHMFKGEVSWQDGTIADMVLKEYLENPPAEDLPRMPPEVADILRRCLQPDPAERWESMLEVANALRQVYEALFGPYPRTMPPLPERKEAALSRQVEGAGWLDPLPYLQRALTSIGRSARDIERFAADRKASLSAQAVADLACYEEVLKIYQEYPSASPGPAELARLYGNKAVLHQYLNDAPGALRAFDHAIQMWEMLVLEQGQLRWANSLAEAYHNRGFLFYRLSRYDEAFQNYERSLAILERSVLEERQFDGLSTLVAAYNNKALALVEVHRPQEAIACYDRAISLLDALSQKTENPQVINHLAITLSNKAACLTGLLKYEEALPIVERAVQLQEKLIFQDRHEEFLEDLATSYANQGGVLARLGRNQEGLIWLEKAIEICERLISQHQRHDLRDALARFYSNKADMLAECGRLEEAVQFHDKAIDIHKQNVIREGKWELAKELVHDYRGKASTLARMGQYQTALETCDRALSILERLVFQEKHSELLEDLAAIYSDKAEVLRLSNACEEALSAQEKAVSLFERAFRQEGRQDVVHSLVLARAYRDQALLLSQMRRYDRSLECYDRAIKICTDLSQKEQDDVAEANAYAHLGKGLVLNECGRYAEAVACCHTAGELFEALWHEKGEERFALLVARCHRTRGNAIARLGIYTEAIHALDKAIAILESCSDQDQAMLCELAHACNDKGFVLDELHRYGQAIPLYDKAIAIWERLVYQERLIENVPSMVAAYNNKAFALLNLGRVDEAIGLCDKAIGAGTRGWDLTPAGKAILSKELSVSHHRKATILGRQGNYEQAIGEYAAGIRYLEPLVLNDGQWEFCFGLANMMVNQGYCLLRVGKRTEGQRILQSALQVMDEGLRHANDPRLLALRHQVQSML